MFQGSILEGSSVNFILRVRFIIPQGSGGALPDSFEPPEGGLWSDGRCGRGLKDVGSNLDHTTSGTHLHGPYQSHSRSRSTEPGRITS